MSLLTGLVSFAIMYVCTYVFVEVCIAKIFFFYFFFFYLGKKLDKLLVANIHKNAIEETQTAFFYEKNESLQDLFPCKQCS